MTLAQLPTRTPDDRTDTIYLVNTRQPRGRHAATRKPGQETVGQLSVGAICLLAGHPAPKRTIDSFPGRHASSDTVAILTLA